MYERWPFWTTTLDNAQMILAKADLTIARLYADLVEDQALAGRIYDRIAAEHRLSVEMVCTVTGQQALLERMPVLGRSIQQRNPYVDPLSFIQTVLLRRLRESDEPPEELRIGRAGEHQRHRGGVEEHGVKTRGRVEDPGQTPSESLGRPRRVEPRLERGPLLGFEFGFAEYLVPGSQPQYRRIARQRHHDLRHADLLAIDLELARLGEGQPDVVALQARRQVGGGALAVGGTRLQQGEGRLDRPGGALLGGLLLAVEDAGYLRPRRPRLAPTRSTRRSRTPRPISWRRRPSPGPSSRRPSSPPTSS